MIVSPKLWLPESVEGGLAHLGHVLSRILDCTAGGGGGTTAARWSVVEPAWAALASQGLSVV